MHASVELEHALADSAELQELPGGWSDMYLCIFHNIRFACARMNDQTCLLPGWSWSNRLGNMRWLGSLGTACLGMYLRVEGCWLQVSVVELGFMNSFELHLK